MTQNERGVDSNATHNLFMGVEMRILLGLLIYFSLVGLADEGACSIDAEKFCSGFTPGGALKKCLKDHVHELSSDCKDYQTSRQKPDPKEMFNTLKKTGKKAAVKSNN